MNWVKTPKGHIRYSCTDLYTVFMSMYRYIHGHSMYSMGAGDNCDAEKVESTLRNILNFSNMTCNHKMGQRHVPGAKNMLETLTKTVL